MFIAMADIYISFLAFISTSLYDMKPLSLQYPL